MNPIQKKLRRSPAHASAVGADFNIEWRGRGEAKCFRIIGDGADEKPATLVEFQNAGHSEFVPIPDGNYSLDPAILDYFDRRNGVLGVECARNLETRCGSCRRFEHVAGEFAVSAAAEQRAI